MATVPKRKIILPPWPMEGPLVRPFPKLKFVQKLGNNALSGYYDEDGEWIETDNEGSGFSFMDFLNTSAGQNLTSTAAQIAARSAGVSPVYNQYGTMVNPYGVAGPTAPYSTYNPTGYRSSTISPMLILGAVAVGAFLLMRKK